MYRAFYSIQKLQLLISPKNASIFLRQNRRLFSCGLEPIHARQKVFPTQLNKGIRVHPSWATNAICYRTFRLTAPRHAPTPVALWLFRNLLTLSTIYLGHRIKAARSAGNRTREQTLKNIASALFIPLIIILVYFYFTHINYSPVTNRRRFLAFKNEEMVEMTDFERQFLELQFGKLFLDSYDPVYQRVLRVVRLIIKTNENIKEVKERKWRLNIIDMPEIKNAFVLPSGDVYVFTGLLQMCRNDDEIGFVVAHEMSHAILEHLAEQVSHMYLGDMLFLVPTFFIWSVFTIRQAIVVHFFARLLTEIVFHLPFSRYSEIEADVVGLTLAAKSCLDVREAVVFWKKMMISKEKEGIPFLYSVEWLSTHPSFEARSFYLERMMPMALHVREEQGCPPLNTADPRARIDELVKEFEDSLDIQ